MSKHHEHGGHYKRTKQLDEVTAKTHDVTNSSSEVLSIFREFAANLDNKHDRYERLVKKSRDVTIESKRIIFMLHRVTSDGERQPLLDEAARRFRHLEATTLRDIAIELRGHDPYVFMRAISPGLQEYIEARTFHHYLQQEELMSWAEVQALLTFPTEAADGAPPPPVAPATASVTTTLGRTPSVFTAAADAADDDDDDDNRPNPATEAASETEADTGEKSPARGSEVVLLLPYHEYVLGLADLTGELMRRCISSVSSGELQQCWRLCDLLRTILKGFINIGNQGPRELTRKTFTLRQSVAKVENACYQLKVRGEEIPEHMLADVFSAADDYPPLQDFAAD